MSQTTKEKPKYINMQPVGLGKSSVLTNFTQKFSSKHWYDTLLENVAPSNMSIHD